MLTPHFTVGKIGFSGKVLAMYRLRVVTVIVSEPCIVNEPPKVPRRLKSGGWTYGVLGVNLWISPWWKH